MIIEVRSLLFLLTITDIISTKGTNQEGSENIQSGTVTQHRKGFLSSLTS